VFGTVHTVSAQSSIERMINAFPAPQQAQVRTMLAETLRAVACQHLLRLADGSGRVAAIEIMLNNEAVSAMIRTGKTFQIGTVVQTSRELGMQSMDSELIRLVKSGLITQEEAYMKANDKKSFEAALAVAQGGAAAPAPAPNPPARVPVAAPSRPGA